MPLSYTATYTTRVGSAYMHAIIQTQSKLLVTHLNGSGIHPPCLCEDIEHLFSEKLSFATIKLLGSPSESTIYVLPPILYLQKAAEQMTYHVGDTQDANMEKIKTFVECDNPNEEGIAIFPSLTKEDAFLMLNKLSQRFEFTGAIHLSQSKQVIFQVNEKNFILEYNRDECHLKETFFCFNLEKGFMGEESFIELLQPHFLRWKNRGYYGPVIPHNPSGFNIDETTCLGIIKSTLYSFFFPPLQFSTKPTDPEKHINMSRSE